MILKLDKGFEKEARRSANYADATDHTGEDGLGEIQLSTSQFPFFPHHPEDYERN
jgi:hypothetical protein